MARRRFRVIKETPELMVGAIVEEACDSGDQEFRIGIKDKHIKFPNDPTNGDSVVYARQVVLKQPSFFEEVHMVEVPASKVAAVKKFLKKRII